MGSSLTLKLQELTWSEYVALVCSTCFLNCFSYGSFPICFLPLLQLPLSMLLSPVELTPAVPSLWASFWWIGWTCTAYWWKFDNGLHYIHEWSTSLLVPQHIEAKSLLCCGSGNAFWVMCLSACGSFVFISFRVGWPQKSLLRSLWLRYLVVPGDALWQFIVIPFRWLGHSSRVVPFWSACFLPGTPEAPFTATLRLFCYTRAGWGMPLSRYLGGCCINVLN